MQMLVQGLGWPVAQPQRPATQTEGEAPAADCVMMGPGLRSAEDELKAQALTLQVVCGARPAQQPPKSICVVTCALDSAVFFHKPHIHCTQAS